MSVVILEHRLIGESERVPIKTEFRRTDLGARERESGKNAEPASSY